MSSILIFVVVVIVVMALVMWLIYYLPLPPGSPAWVKNFLYVMALLAAIVVILVKSGLAASI
jgi:branched-subunit amino acid transport protein